MPGRRPEPLTGRGWWPKLRVKAFLTSPPNRAAKLAVLYASLQLKGRTYSSRHVTGFGLAWFRRVAALKNAGYAGFAKRAQYALHCPPRAFVAASLSGTRTPGSCRSLPCPWCYASFVARTYRRVSEAAAGVGHILFMARRQSCKHVEFTPAVFEAACAAASARAGRLAAAGVLWKVTADPRPGGVSVRQVVIAWTPDGTLEAPFDWPSWKVPAAEAGPLATRMGNVLRYPIGMMYHPSASAALALNTVDSAACYTTGVSGRFRRQVAEDPELETP